MTDRTAVREWVVAYERAWRTSGTDGLSALFTADAAYQHSPYEEPIVGIHAIGKMWNEDREGSDEVFTLSTDIVAVERDMAVVRAEVHYGEPIVQEYRDLWLIRFGADGRCTRFEEWPYWPGRPYAAPEEMGPPGTAPE